MEQAALTLEYLKVVLRYVLSFPVVVLVLALVFRRHIGSALDALLEVTYPGGSARFQERRRERTELSKFLVTADQTKTATAYATLQRLQNSAPRASTSEQDRKLAEGIASFFGLAMRLLPLIPKAERKRFIEEETKDLPDEFEGFRQALLGLADTAPEVHALKLGEVLTSESFSLGRLSGREAGIIPPLPRM